MEELKAYVYIRSEYPFETVVVLAVSREEADVILLRDNFSENTTKENIEFWFNKIEEKSLERGVLFYNH